MKTDEFYEQVSRRMGDEFEISPKQLVDAVFQTLAAHWPAAELTEFGKSLPLNLRHILAATTGDGNFNRENFLEELAERLDLDDADAEKGASAVFISLRETLQPSVPMQEVLESLPPDLAQMMAQ